MTVYPLSKVSQNSHHHSLPFLSIFIPLPTTDFCMTMCCVLVAFCVYKGVAYTQGQTWQDGCSTTCRCDDADNNIYNCFDRYISEEILFQKKSFMVFRNQFVITSFTISFQAKTTHTDVQFTIMN